VYPHCAANVGWHIIIDVVDIGEVGGEVRRYTVAGLLDQQY